MALLCVLLAAGCGAKQNEETTVEGETTVEAVSTKVVAKVVAYHEDMIHFEYDDGTGEWLDGTELEVQSPAEFTTKPLYICHQPVAPVNSLWRQVGATVQFEFQEEDLDPAGCAHVQVPEEAIAVEEVPE
jgi:hypothetical protein